MYDIQTRTRGTGDKWKTIAKALTPGDAENVRVHILDEYPELDVRVNIGEIRDQAGVAEWLGICFVIRYMRVRILSPAPNL